MKRFSLVLIQWEAFVYGTCCKLSFKALQDVFLKGGSEILFAGRGGFARTHRKTQAGLCIPLTRSAFFAETIQISGSFLEPPEDMTQHSVLH